MQDTIYHSDTTRVSKSGLDLIHSSPAEFYRHYFIRRLPETDAMRTGREMHAKLFEPDVYWNDVHNRVNRETQELLTQMTKSIRQHPAARLLLQSGVAESVHLWTDETTGIDCKLKADWLTSIENLVVDLKTTKDSSPSGFRRSCRQMRYHVQAAFYLDGLAKTSPRDGFVFICVEKKYPFKVAVYEAPDAMICEGREMYLEDLHRLKKCREENHWPAYDTPLIQALPWP